jgi:hypothetical protein
MVQPSADDKTAPQVLWTSPGDGDVIILPDVTSVVTDTVGPAYVPSLLVKFSEPLDTATVTAANIRIKNEKGVALDVTPNYSEWSNWLAIVMREPWQPGKYTVTLTSSLKDASGNPLSSRYRWSFVVEAAAGDGAVYLPVVIK